MSLQQTNKVIIYTKDYCPYCVKAKNILSASGLEFEEIDITNDAILVTEMMEKSNGARTVPQIFIGDQYIGGCDSLEGLHNSGKLQDFL